MWHQLANYHSTFFFYMDPLNNDRGLGCHLQPFKIKPLMGYP